ncbi:peptidase_M28 domain-containing protein [Caerostris darwini]|uniref:Peptidase_M28 domain-containing protein n=1 Tax=Caerostris darwini TaxID=1538125 RepID=A0AAV4WNY0_9ARAC|nr:peptidase_M28 domain-containing protein [Caerostris darwini]
MRYIYFLFLLIFLNIDVSKECALPFWWTEQYHFQPYYQITGQPKSTYRYRETFHRSYPDSFVHIQEYSEYTWWEHDVSSNGRETKLTPEDIRHMTNVVFSKDGSINGIIPGKRGMHPVGGNTNRGIPRGFGVKGGFPVKGGTNGMFPVGRNGNGLLPRSGDTNGMVTRGDTNGIVTRGDTNGMVTRADTNGIVTRGDTNGMVTRGDTTGTSTVEDTTRMVTQPDTTRMITDAETNGIATGGDTNGITMPDDMNGIMTDEDTMQTSEVTPEVITSNPDREVNENEDFEINKSGDLLDNDLEMSGAAKSSSELRIKEPNSKGDFLGGWFGTRTNETEPCKVSETDIHSLRSMIEKMFSQPREHMINPESKEKAREDILNKFRNYGLQVWTQNFTTPPIKHPNGTEDFNEGVNLVGVIPGSQRGRLDDEIVLVGAHYDTVADSNGVDDNGSGLAVMLEVARAITEARCRLNHTLMFVAFDHEENGAMGSNYFVDHYLIPDELKRARARFQGAFILDGIMNYNDIPNTQELPLDYTESLPGFQYFVNNTGNRGNFLAMISRNEMDSHLSRKLMDAWQDLGDHQYKLFNLAVDMGNTIPDPSVIQKHLNFLRSDHATFWYHNSSNHFPDSLNAVLLTDTGPFRGQMKQCYHSKCDDLTVITPEKLQFAKKTADALTATLVELTSATAGGRQIHASWLMISLHVMALFYAAKFLRSV